MTDENMKCIICGAINPKSLNHLSMYTCVCINCQIKNDQTNNAIAMIKAINKNKQTLAEHVGLGCDLPFEMQDWTGSYWCLLGTDYVKVADSLEDFKAGRNCEEFAIGDKNINGEFVYTGKDLTMIIVGDGAPKGGMSCWFFDNAKVVE